MHEELGHWMADKGVDLVLGVGPMGSLAARAAMNSCPGSTSIEKPDDVCDMLLDRVLPGDVILVKGSRASAMDKVVDELIAKLGEEKVIPRCSTT